MTRQRGAEEDDMDDDDEPRHEEEGINGRWFVRLETGRLPIHLGDDYRRQKSTAVWPSEDDLTSSP